MFDLAIIGAGWAGFSAAQEAKRLNLKVVLIEKGDIGGTCLMRGCIPTKALIQSARVFTLSKKSAKFGIETTDPKINFQELQKRKQDIIRQLSKGMQVMLSGITFMKGQAQFISNEELIVGQEKVKAKYIIIATGSKPVELTDLRFDGKKIISSSDILNLNSQPKSLLIVGAGAIGCEFASLFSMLGTKVTIIELMPQLLPQEDREVAKRLEIIFRKRGIEVNTNTDAKSVDLNNYELVLLCIGRTPDLGNLDLERIGIRLEKNRIATNQYLSTNISNIFAAGDCTGGKLLAHFAAHQGVTAARNIAKGTAYAKQTEVQFVPSCIFTEPEVARVGITEEEANTRGIKVKINKFDFLGSGMARIIDQAEGFIKIVSNKENQDILGASIIGPKATEIIGIIAVAIGARLKLSELHNIIFAHPTLSESIHEATKE